MTTAIQWTYQLVLQTRTAAGTILHLWQPATGHSPTRCGPPTYPKEEAARQLVNYDLATLIKGYRGHLVVTWDVADVEVKDVTPGVSTHAHLKQLLYDLSFYAGSYIQVSLDNGSHYTNCELASSVEFDNQDGKNVGLHLELEFVAISLTSTIPTLTAGAW